MGRDEQWKARLHADYVGGQAAVKHASDVARGEEAGG